MRSSCEGQPGRYRGARGAGAGLHAQSAAELYQLACILGPRPGLLQALCVDAERHAGVRGIYGPTLLQHRGPVLAEVGLELPNGYVELVRFEECRLAGDGVVVVVDVLLRADGLRRDLPFGNDADAILLEHLLHQGLHRRRQRMGLYEHESRVRRGVGRGRSLGEGRPELG